MDILLTMKDTQRIHINSSRYYIFQMRFPWGLAVAPVIVEQVGQKLELSEFAIEPQQSAK